MRTASASVSRSGVPASAGLAGGVHQPVERARELDSVYSVGDQFWKQCAWAMKRKITLLFKISIGIIIPMLLLSEALGD